jgi:hypothetical protein
MDLIRSIFELGVDEAYRLLVEAGLGENLPPLDAIENEDWGRDMLLTRLWQLSNDTLEKLGLQKEGDGSAAV